MAGSITIINENPHQDGVDAGKKLGADALRKETREKLAHPYLKRSLGAMSRDALQKYVLARLETAPNYTRFPELEDVYPERVEYLRGFAQGAGVSLGEAATHHYVAYKLNIDNWYYSLQAGGAGAPTGKAGCTGILMVGPDGVIGAHSAESTPPPKPRGYKVRPPRPYKGTKVLPIKHVDLTLIKPRTGYISNWGTTNEKGVGCAAGVSCSIWHDDPIEDTWPVHEVPLLRFATSVKHLVELYTRYTLHNWSRASQVWADTSGNGCIIEKTYRLIGVRWIGSAPAIWCTEGHFESDHMNAFARSRRLDYFAKSGKHLGCDDNQFYTDCAVRFCHIGELCHMPWGHGVDHMRRVLVDTAPFPRGINRCGGPDTDKYDGTVTMAQSMTNFTANRHHGRGWIPWKKFVHEVPEGIGEYPPRPGAI